MMRLRAKRTERQTSSEIWNLILKRSEIRPEIPVLPKIPAVLEIRPDISEIRPEIPVLPEIPSVLEIRPDISEIRP